MQTRKMLNFVPWRPRSRKGKIRWLFCAFNYHILYLCWAKCIHSQIT